MLQSSKTDFRETGAVASLIYLASSSSMPQAGPSVFPQKEPHIWCPRNREAI